MFPNGQNIKWIQLQSKHGICPKLGTLGKYFQFISMNKFITNWNYLFARTKDGRPWPSFMFPKGHNIKWIQLQSKHGICPKVGALGKYFQFISMNKSITNWNYLFAGIEQGLIQQSASTSNQSYSHSKDKFFFYKKNPWINLHLFYSIFIFIFFTFW